MEDERKQKVPGCPALSFSPGNRSHNPCSAFQRNKPHPQSLPSHPKGKSIPGCPVAFQSMEENQKNNCAQRKRLVQRNWLQTTQAGESLFYLPLSPAARCHVGDIASTVQTLGARHWQIMRAGALYTLILSCPSFATGIKHSRE